MATHAAPPYVLAYLVGGAQGRDAVLLFRPRAWIHGLDDLDRGEGTTGIAGEQFGDGTLNAARSSSVSWISALPSGVVV